MAKRSALRSAMSANPEKLKAIEALTGGDAEEEEPKRRGRRKKKTEPQTRLNADIPTVLYDEFYTTVEIYGGGNMTRVVNDLVQEYVLRHKKK